MIRPCRAACERAEALSDGRVFDRTELVEDRGDAVDGEVGASGAVEPVSRLQEVEEDGAVELGLGFGADGLDRLARSIGGASGPRASASSVRIAGSKSGSDGSMWDRRRRFFAASRRRVGESERRAFRIQRWSSRSSASRTRISAAVRASAGESELAVA
jgi:hypothetical protein